MKAMNPEEAVLQILAGVEAFTQHVVQQALAQVTIRAKTEAWISLAEAAKRLGYEDRNATKDVKKLCTSGELIYRKKSENSNSHYQVLNISIDLYQAKSILSLLPNKAHFAGYRQELQGRIGKLEK
jgi:hypothetical protein